MIPGVSNRRENRETESSYEHECDKQCPPTCALRPGSSPGQTPIVKVPFRPYLPIAEEAAIGKDQEPFLSDGSSTRSPTVTLSPPSEHMRQVRRLVIGRNGLPRTRFQTLRLNPRVDLWTRSGQLASHLIGILGSGADQGDLVQLTLLSSVPPRLHLSDSLFESVAFWCCSQMDERRSLETPSVSTLHHYSKALSSLQVALQSDSAYDAETLAAAVLLHRAGPIFNRAIKPDAAAHAKGISSLVVQRGPPKLNDDLDASLANELGLMLFCWHSHEHGHECGHSGESFPDKEADPQEPEHESKQYSLPIEEEDYIQGAFGRMVQLIPDIKSIHDDPTSEEMIALSSDIRERIYVQENELSLLTTRIKKDVFQQGLLQIIPDPTHFVGQRFHFASISVAQLILEILLLEIIVPKILYDFSVLYDSDDKDTLFKKYRDASVELWMCIPYLSKLNLGPAQILSCAFSITYDAAEDPEKDHVLDAAMQYDFYLRRFTHDRALLEERVMRCAKQLTGRAETMPIQLLMGGQSQGLQIPSQGQDSGAGRRSDLRHLLHGCLFFERILGATKPK